MLLLQRDVAAPVAAEPVARDNGKDEAQRDRREADQKPAERVRMKPRFQRRAGEVRHAQQKPARRHRQLVAEARTDAFAPLDALGAAGGDHPVDQPHDPQRRDERLE